ncbi:hypothetical protein ONZ45_g11737 [Pleurotus djamor]|nr:hypothetical protein ONZ45_g11737 [Pleurotus djamor]
MAQEPLMILKSRSGPVDDEVVGWKQAYLEEPWIRTRYQVGRDDDDDKLGQAMVHHPRDEYPGTSLSASTKNMSMSTSSTLSCDEDGRGYESEEDEVAELVEDGSQDDDEAVVSAAKSNE